MRLKTNPLYEESRGSYWPRSRTQWVRSVAVVAGGLAAVVVLEGLIAAAVVAAITVAFLVHRGWSETGKSDTSGA
jgi:hypothetical protein